jgi:hypothetical protein
LVLLKSFLFAHPHTATSTIMQEENTLEILMDRERLAHDKLEREINKEIDAEIQKYIGEHAS